MLKTKSPVKIDLDSKFSQLELKEVQVLLDHSQIALKHPFLQLVPHITTQQSCQWPFIFKTWATTPIRSLLSTMNSKTLFHTNKDTWNLCQERDSLNQCNSLSCITRLFQIRTPVTHHSMNFIWPQISGLHFWTVLLPNNPQEWMQWRTHQRMPRKSLKNWPSNTTTPDNPELQLSFVRLLLVPQLSD